ncbi:MAG: hypothetical protein ACYDBP_07290 [Leptospirales bacterium]
MLIRFNDDVLTESTHPEVEIEYVDIGNVSAEKGIERIELLQFGTAPSRARRLVKDGDVIVSTVRTYLKAIESVAERRATRKITKYMELLLGIEPRTFRLQEALCDIHLRVFKRTLWPSVKDLRKSNRI